MKIRQDMVQNMHQHMKTITKELKFRYYIHFSYFNGGNFNVNETALQL